MGETDSTEQGTEASSGVAAAAVLMIVASFGSAVTGLVRETAYAGRFGRSGPFAAYLAAFGIPDLMYFLIAGGALRTGFIPVFTRYISQGKESQAWRTFSVLFCWLLVIGSGLVLLGMLTSDWLTYAVAPGFDPPTHDLCAHLMRIMFPAQVFFLLGGLLMGTLNSLRHFLWPAIGPIVYNLIIIAATVVLTPHLGVPGLAGSVVVGALVSSFILQVPSLWRRGVRLDALFDWRDEGLRQVLALILPITFGLAISELSFIVVKSIATMLGTAAIPTLNYANRLVKLPERVFGAGIAIAVFPALSAHFAVGEKDRFRQDVSFGLRNVMFLGVPSAVVLIVLAAPIVRLLFQHGSRFTDQDTTAVAHAVVWFALSVPALAGQYVIARAFYAMHETRAPVVVGVFSEIACGLLAWFLRVPMGVNGLALAYSLSSIGNAIVLLEMLRRRAGGIDGRRLLVTTGRTAAGGAVLAAICWAGAMAVADRLGTAGFAARLIAVAGPAGLGTLLYVGIYTRLGGTEAASAWQMVTRRLRRGESANGE